MAIDTALISRLEKLARLQLSKAEREKFAADLSNILEMVDKLKTLDTTGIEPLVYLTDDASPMREDQSGDHFSQSEALQNAPKQDGKFFSVPKVIS